MKIIKDKNLTESSNNDEIILDRRTDKDFHSKYFELKDKGYKTVWTGEGKIKLRKTDEIPEPRRVFYNQSESLTESFSSDERAVALALYLGVDPKTITNTYNDVFETEDGEEYFVVTDAEAYDLAKDDIESLFDDMGLDSFTTTFQQWILDNAVEDGGWFSDILLEMEAGYVEDIKYEEGRLVKELIEAGIVESEEEYHEDEEGAEERYVDYLVDDSGDPVDYFRSEFGEDEFSKVVRDNNFIDMDKVVEEAIEMDGVAHFIALYDGEEIELDNGLFAYRIN